MYIKLVVSILSFFLFSNYGFCQLDEKEVKRIPSNYSNLVYSLENEVGLLMSYKQFKKGNFVEASAQEKSTLMTTMLLGSATFLYEYLSEKYPDFNPVVIQPNGFTRTSFEVKYQFFGGEVFIMRLFKARNGLNLMSAEDPTNYRLIFGFKIEDVATLLEIEKVLKQYWFDTNIKFGGIEIN